MKKLILIGLGFSVITFALGFLMPTVKDTTIEDSFDYDKVGWC